MGKKRLTIAAVVVLLLAGSGVVVLWNVLDWPPPRLILKYGFPPAGWPTGKTKTIAGMEFVELSPGYEACRFLRDEETIDGELVVTEEWIEAWQSLWIARSDVPRDLWESSPMIKKGGAGSRRRWEVAVEQFPVLLGKRLDSKLRWATPEETAYAIRRGVLDGEDDPLVAVDAYRGLGPRGYLVGPGWAGTSVAEVFHLMMHGPDLPAIGRRLVWIPPED